MGINSKELLRYEKLIWSKGNQLENAVRDAFYTLGFIEIKKGRAMNLEDYIIDFKAGGPPFLGVMEIKGSDKRTSLSDLTQCNRWAEDYLIEQGIPSKGIFVPNQCILEPYPESREKRLHFEPNELYYAGTRDICIIPACELFEAICEVLNGNTKISRNYIENKIYTTNGLCKLI
jgi:hypothetical protein